MSVPLKIVVWNFVEFGAKALTEKSLGGVAENRSQTLKVAKLSRLPPVAASLYLPLLGGSPTQQRNYAEKLNVVSLDSKQAMLLGLAGTGKSIWPGNSGVKVTEGNYNAFRVSMQKQREFWWGNL